MFDKPTVQRVQPTAKRMVFHGSARTGGTGLRHAVAVYYLTDFDYEIRLSGRVQRRITVAARPDEQAFKKQIAETFHVTDVKLSSTTPRAQRPRSDAK